MTPSALFGILQLDRGEPLGYANAAGLAQAWLQDAGGFAAVGLVAYLLYALSVPTAKSQSERMRVPVSTWMLVMAGLSLVCYAGVFALLYLGQGGSPVPPLPPPGSPVPVEPPRWHPERRPLLLMAAGLFALLGIGEPFARDLLKTRGRRVWALSKLSFKEAVRSRILWVFLIILLPFLFPAKWFIKIKPADELRTMVETVSFALMILILVPGALLAAFYGIPNDIKNQTIHTVVTKPVERFEIVLGRFLGYSFLMTLVLAGLTAFCLVLINTTKLDPRAEQETAKARVPVRGKLEFKARAADFAGTNVGREFEYRKYISGHPNSPERAVWTFASPPPAMLTPPGDVDLVEFTFDVYRLTKGEENRGVNVAFRFVTQNCPQSPPTQEQRGEWQWASTTPDPQDNKTPEQRYRDDVQAYRDKGENPDGARPGTPGWAAASALAEKYGIYEVRGKEVFDYAVMGVEVPAGLFRNARAGDPKAGGPPRVAAYVKCESPGQLLGMAEPDLYLLEGNQPFSVNFAKGMFGLWCRLLIAVGLVVACSTYLSGVLSLLAAALVYLIGYAGDHLNDLATNRNIGGGPFESMSRLLKAEQPTVPTSDTAGARVLQIFDKGFAWVVRRVQNVIPDVESFTWTNFVSEGFNISGEYLLVNLLVTAGYLTPWAVLAYYLMKSREVAS